MKFFLCCSIVCRLWHVLAWKSLMRKESVVQSPTCLLKTRRLADCHGKCFVPRRWRCSLPQPLERVSPTAHRPTELGLCHATQLSTIHHLRHLSCQGDMQVRCVGEQQLRTWRGRGHSFFQRRQRAVHGNVRFWLKMVRRNVVSSVRRRS